MDDATTGNLMSPGSGFQAMNPLTPDLVSARMEDGGHQLSCRMSIKDKERQSLLGDKREIREQQESNKRELRELYESDKRGIRE